MMRPLPVLALLIFVTPAAAQAPPDPGQATAADLAVAEEAARRRQVDLENRLNALDAARRADEAVRALREQSARASVAIPWTPAPPIRLDPGKVATIPDDWLAASNVRVRAAAENRR